MCRFCVEHGDGKRWYLQAANYAYDLESDLERRGYIVSFISGFENRRSRIRAGLGALRALPKPVADLARARASRRAQRDHFGQPVPIEECSQILEMATSIVRLPCLCRGQRRSEEGVCLAITVRPFDDVLAEGFASYADGPDASSFEHLDRTTALALLRNCERHGLAHTVWTFKTPFVAAICNCDVPSGCIAMNLQLNHDIKIMWKGEWVVSLTEELCDGCGSCITVCPFGALAESRNGGPVSLDQSACWGCGTCRATCTTGALGLLERRTVAQVATSW